MELFKKCAKHRTPSGGSPTDEQESKTETTALGAPSDELLRQEPEKAEQSKNDKYTTNVAKESEEVDNSQSLYSQLSWNRPTQDPVPLNGNTLVPPDAPEEIVKTTAPIQQDLEGNNNISGPWTATVQQSLTAGRSPEARVKNRNNQLASMSQSNAADHKGIA